MLTFRCVSGCLRLSLGAVLLAASTACTPSDGVPLGLGNSSDDGREIEALRAEVARLKDENARLRLTSAALAAEVNTAVTQQDGGRAQAALKQLAERFPLSAELPAARKRVDGLLAKLRSDADEKKRIAALGFRALRSNTFFARGDTAIRLTDPTVSRRWTFDSYGHGWRYLDPEKGQRMITARVNVTSGNKDPALFSIGAYVADGAILRQVGTLRYRFARWADFGAFLGTHADFGNDFARSSRIPFTVGVAVNEDDLKRRPLYLVATREGCHKKLFDRQLQPPIHYVSSDCASLKKTLTVNDFQDGALAVLKRID